MSPPPKPPQGCGCPAVALLVCWLIVPLSKHLQLSALAHQHHPNTHPHPQHPLVWPHPHHHPQHLPPCFHVRRAATWCSSQSTAALRS
jgi:hypothetical protein